MANIYDAENFDPRMGVGHLLYRLRAELLASMDREFAADEQLAAMQGTSAQLIVLAMLSSGEVKSATDLCRGISYDAGAMTRMIDRLSGSLCNRPRSCVTESRIAPFDSRRPQRSQLACPNWKPGVFPGQTSGHD
jgi:hypothetical protein